MFPPKQEAADDAKETDQSPGVSPENPIVLEENLKVDLERFLGVLYPQHRAYIKHAMSPASLNAFDRIVAGRKYGVLQWFLDGIIAIAGAHTAEISSGDAPNINLGTALSLYHLKGRIKKVARHSAFDRVGSMDELRDERCIRRTLYRDLRVSGKRPLGYNV
ncbi:hypothetical protein PQX77_002970 [Marasmius sp. AFHP31]|nr:hypothetical protein PQX77_002970 [Marasmius sp. AFHP31]